MTSAALLLLSSLAQAVASDPAAPPKRPAFGWVMDDARQPVVGARVEVLAGANASEPVAATASGQFGRFHLSALPPGRYTLRITAAGYSTLVEPLVQIPPGAQPHALGRLRLERRAALEGKVTASDGKPLAGALIWLILPGQGAGPAASRPTTTSDGKGELRIPDLDRSIPVKLFVCRQGFQPVSHPVDDPANPTTVVLSKGARIEGRVVNSEREPISGAGITVDPPPCGNRLGSTMSNAEGRFVVDSLELKSYNVRAEASGYVDAVQRVFADSVHFPRQVELVLGRATLVVGTVVSDSGAPVAGAVVQALGDRTRPSGASDAEGRFILHGVEPVVQPFLVSHRDYRPTETSLRVEEDGSSRFKFVLTRIRRLAVSGSVLAPDGSAVPGARVQLGDKVLAVTNARGQFSLIRDNGTYALTAFKAGFAPGSTRPPVVVEGRPVSGITIRLGKSAAVSGRLLGLPAGAELQVSASSPPLSVQGTVGRDGSYRIADLGEGDWEVTARADERSAKGSVRLGKDDAEKRLDLTFAPSSRSLDGGRP